MPVAEVHLDAVPVVLSNSDHGVRVPSAGTAATVVQFTESDPLSILDHQRQHDHTRSSRRSEPHNLQQGTSG
ncbi:hypothetical protein OG582_00060 [Streptomyces anulatus]|uniref:hypothetical protein n=1 Tax=Streptomyces anulatus TaxID=1892 RepID=UPI002F90F97D|nr:hypothetical protein OH737_40120 [Streptomyces anulatus]